MKIWNVTFEEMLQQTEIWVTRSNEPSELLSTQVSSWWCLLWKLFCFFKLCEFRRTLSTSAVLLWLFTTVGSCVLSMNHYNWNPPTYFTYSMLLHCLWSHATSSPRHNGASFPSGAVFTWFLTSVALLLFKVHSARKCESSPTCLVNSTVRSTFNLYSCV